MERNRHVDEGTLHAWLDGALGPEESSRVEAHVAECAECGGKAAEARGLIAAASRILTALDDVPGGVVPRVRRQHRRQFLTGWPLRAAAAIVFVAVGSFAVVERISEPNAAAVKSQAAPAPLATPSPTLPPVSATAPPPHPVAKTQMKKFAPMRKENAPAAAPAPPLDSIMDARRMSPAREAAAQAVAGGLPRRRVAGVGKAQAMRLSGCYITRTPGLRVRIQSGDSTESWTREGPDSIRIVITDSTGVEQRIVARVTPVGLSGVVTTGDTASARPFVAIRCP